jgi:hypothetical protein
MSGDRKVPRFPMPKSFCPPSSSSSSLSADTEHHKAKTYTGKTAALLKVRFAEQDEETVVRVEAMEDRIKQLFEDLATCINEIEGANLTMKGFQVGTVSPYMNSQNSCLIMFLEQVLGHWLKIFALPDEEGNCEENECSNEKSVSCEGCEDDDEDDDDEFSASTSSISSEEVQTESEVECIVPTKKRARKVLPTKMAVSDVFEREELPDSNA